MWLNQNIINIIFGLDGWGEGGLGQQINDGGGCTKMHKRLEKVESPGTYVTE